MNMFGAWWRYVVWKRAGARRGKGSTVVGTRRVPQVNERPKAAATSATVTPLFGGAAAPRPAPQPITDAEYAELVECARAIEGRVRWRFCEDCSQVLARVILDGTGAPT